MFILQHMCILVDWFNFCLNCKYTKPFSILFMDLLTEVILESLKQPIVLIICSSVDPPASSPLSQPRNVLRLPDHLTDLRPPHRSSGSTDFVICRRFVVMGLSVGEVLWWW
ncbi:hypothetical protein Hanom_Chr02g00151601 [Helianthus anomalus]